MSPMETFASRETEYENWGTWNVTVDINPATLLRVALVRIRKKQAFKFCLVLAIICQVESDIMD